MSEQDNYYILLDLVKYGIDIDRYYKEKDYNLIEWHKIFELSKCHRISALAYDGLTNLKNIQKVSVDKEHVSDWEKNIDHQKIIDFVQKVAFDEIVYALKQQQILYYPFKGFSLKELYSKTYHREMTDLDFFIHQEDFSETIRMLEANGYEKLKYSNIQVTTLQKAPFINVEIQSSFFNDHQSTKFSSYFKELIPTQDNKDFRLHWETTTLYIYLFCHLYKHMQNGGIGIRFLLDLWLFEQQETGNIDWSKVENDLIFLGIDDEYHQIKGVMVDWFEKNRESDQEELATFIFSSGIFGMMDFFIHNKLTLEKNVYVYIFKRIFPSVSFLKILYPDMKTHPLFLPYYWIKRALYAVNNNWESILYEFRVLKNRKKKEMNS